jgi:hypothetical protein
VCWKIVEKAACTASVTHAYHSCSSSATAVGSSKVEGTQLPAVTAHRHLQQQRKLTTTCKGSLSDAADLGASIAEQRQCHIGTQGLIAPDAHPTETTVRPAQSYLKFCELPYIVQTAPREVVWQGSHSTWPAKLSLEILRARRGSNDVWRFPVCVGSPKGCVGWLQRACTGQAHCCVQGAQLLPSQQPPWILHR